MEFTYLKDRHFAFQFYSLVWNLHTLYIPSSLTLNVSPNVACLKSHIFHSSVCSFQNTNYKATLYLGYTLEFPPAFVHTDKYKPRVPFLYTISETCTIKTNTDHISSHA